MSLPNKNTAKEQMYSFDTKPAFVYFKINFVYVIFSVSKFT